MTWHTPGPFAIEHVDDGSESYEAITAADGTLIVARSCGQRFARPADASLLQAAPDLLRALRLSIGGNGHTITCLAGQRGHGECAELCRIFRAAIAKATPPDPPSPSPEPIDGPVHDPEPGA